MRSADPPPLRDDIRARLAKLLGMLGSAHDGEVVAAGRMADRLVREAGATWFDVVAPALPRPMRAAPSEPDDPTPTDLDRIRRDWRYAAMWCLRHGGDLLRYKDRDFLHTIAAYRRRPSDPQLVWLQGLVERVLRAEGVA